MWNRKLNVLFWSVVLVLTGCEKFQLEGEHFVELSDEPTTEVFLKLLEMPDTLVLLKDTQISYSFDLSTTADFAVYLVLDGTAYYLSSTKSGSFIIPKNRYLNKYVDFEFAVLTTTSTGSLADYYKRELLVWSVKRVLKFDNSPVEKLNFTLTEERDGKVFLSWPRYPQDNLLQLTLKRSWSPSSGVTPTTKLIYLDSDVTSFTDTTFVGGIVKYTLLTKNNYSLEATGDEVTITEPPQAIVEVNSIDANEVELKWNKPQYYGNATGYRVQVKGTSKQFYIENLEDTVLQIDGLSFGGISTINLTTESKDPSQNVLSANGVSPGQLIPGIQKLIDDPDRDRNFFLNAPLVVRAEGESRDTLSLDFESNAPSWLSEDGNKLYVTKVDMIYEINTTSFSLTNTYPVNRIEQKYQILEKDDKFYLIYRRSGTSSQILVYDKVTKSIIQDLKPGGTENMRRISLSPDKNYLVESGIGIRLEVINSDGTLTELTKVRPGGDCHVRFINDTQIALINKPSSDHTWYESVYSIPDLIEVSPPVLLFSSPNAFQFDLDYSQVGTYSIKSNPSIFDVIDLETAGIKKKITTNSSSGDNLKLYGGYVYHNGYLTKFE